MLSQQQPTKSSNKTVEIPVSQVTQLYKIVKQNEYLKERVKIGESALQEAQTVIGQSKINYSKLEEVSNAKSKMIDDYKLKIEEERKIFNAQKIQLQSEFDLYKIQTKKDSKKQFWKGVKIGGITVGVLGTAAVVYLISK